MKKPGEDVWSPIRDSKKMVEDTGVEPVSLDSGVLDKSGHAGTDAGQDPTQPGQVNRVAPSKRRLLKSNPDISGTSHTQIRNPIRGQSASGVANPWPIKTAVTTPDDNQLARLLAVWDILPREVRDRLILHVERLVLAGGVMQPTHSSPRTHVHASESTPGNDEPGFDFALGMSGAWAA